MTSTSLDQQILASLKQDLPRGSKSDFQCQGKTAIIDPKIEVNHVGGIRLPLKPRRVRQIIQQCQLAPYGKGRDTFVDTRVRKVWELDPKHFAIRNQDWQLKLDAIVGQVAKGLGFDDAEQAHCSLRAKLYKMLVYEKGSFFLPHQDTEKQQGMVATLIIALPSEHSGGTLIVEHQGQQKKISFGGVKSGEHMQYAAFFSDCQHEVKPIKEGYRVCLVYNLLVKRTKKQSHVVTSSTDALTSLLAEWHQQQDKLVFVFDHQYTQAQLALNYMKAQDHEACRQLLAAAKAANYDAHLALLSFYEIGEPECQDDDAYGYRSSRNYYYHYDEDMDEEEDEDEESDTSKGDDDYASCPMEHVVEEYYSADYWSTPEGESKQLPDIAIAESSIVANVAFKALKADETEYEGYMGNYGPTLERWYRRAALVLWPTSAALDIYLKAGLLASATALQDGCEKIEKNKNLKDKKEQTQQYLSFAKTVLGSEKFFTNGHRQTRYLYGQQDQPNSGDSALTLLMKSFVILQDEKLSRTLLGHPFHVLLEGTEGAGLVKLLNSYGWAKFKPELLSLFKNALGKTKDESADQESEDDLYLLIQLIAGMHQTLTTNEQKGSGKFEILKACAEQVKIRLIRWHTADCLRVRRISAKSENPSRALSILFKTGDRLFDDPEGWVNTLCQPSKQNSLHGVLIPLIQEFLLGFNKKSAAGSLMLYFLNQMKLYLEDLTKAEIQSPTDWKINAQWECTCADCGLLRIFISNPEQQQMRVKMAKARRQHMHNTIDSVFEDEGIPDLEHVTERGGSPLTLVLTKNRDSHQTALRQRKLEIKVLGQLRGKLRTLSTSANNKL
ncbi:MAG: 2OG-Fe(II) oxygenase [Gammaproteobacteria bacterium]|nr:2OG-Fe(II) oxygenase [Gammaproteobacteria bacterium]